MNVITQNSYFYLANNIQLFLFFFLPFEIFDIIHAFSSLRE